MEPRLKQRLVGAIVLVALGVIFIPMLLEGPGKGLGPPGSNIPQEPKETFRNRAEDLKMPAAPMAPPERGALLDATPVARPAPAGGTPAGAAVPPAAGATAAPAAPPVAAAPTAPAPAPATSGDAAPQVPQGLGAWVVQVGSFGQAANAAGLRDKLTAAGFTAFVEQVRTAQGMVYRVRVGPELERSAAEALRDRLQKDIHLNGIVTHYP